MKKSIIIGAIIMALGLLIGLGPQFLFKVCTPVEMSLEPAEELTDDCGDDGSCGCSGGAALTYPTCHWTARAEIGIGLLIIALGACVIVFTDPKTQLGLLIGTFLASIIALAVPHTLIGGCDSMAMQCRRVAFPALTVESVVLLVFSAVMLVCLSMTKPAE